MAIWLYFLVPGLDAVPAQPIVQREILFQAPTILAVDPHILIAAIERLKLALVVLARNSQQEIREVHACLAAEENEIAIQLSDRIGVHLIVVEFSTHHDGVRPHNFRKVIAPLKSVVDLLQLVGVGTDREIIEVDIFHALGLRR